MQVVHLCFVPSQCSEEVESELRKAREVFEKESGCAVACSHVFKLPDLCSVQDDVSLHRAIVAVAGVLDEYSHHAGSNTYYMFSICVGSVRESHLISPTARFYGIMITQWLENMGRDCYPLEAAVQPVASLLQFVFTPSISAGNKLPQASVPSVPFLVMIPAFLPCDEEIMPRMIVRENHSIVVCRQCAFSEN